MEKVEYSNTESQVSQKPQRITEQDARAIIDGYKYSPYGFNDFIEKELPALVTKLNAGREPDYKAQSEIRNIVDVKRTSDQSVQLVFSSCRTASVFEKWITEKAAIAKHEGGK